MNWYMLLLDAGVVIVAVAIWAITRAYLEHRAYVRMFDGHDVGQPRHKWCLRAVAHWR